MFDILVKYSRDIGDVCGYIVKWMNLGKSFWLTQERTWNFYFCKSRNLKLCAKVQRSCNKVKINEDQIQAEAARVTNNVKYRYTIFCVLLAQLKSERERERAQLYKKLRHLAQVTVVNSYNFNKLTDLCFRV